MTKEMLNLIDPTREDVQQALAAMPSKAEAIRLMKAHGGVERLSELPKTKFQAVIKAVIDVTANAASGKANAKAQAEPKKSLTDEDVKAIYAKWNNSPRKPDRAEG